MNVSSVANTVTSYYSQQSKASRDISGFAGVIERLINYRSMDSISTSSTAAAEKAAAVRAGLDEQTLAYLDKYTEIYNKYAAEYGDGFELKGTMYISGDPESEAEARKYSEIRSAFQSELYGAGIPGEYLCEPMLIKEGDEFYGFAVARGNLGGKNTGIDALFYAEKYGLAGLSAEEMVKQVLGGMKASSYNEMREAVEKLYLAGAISGFERLKIDVKSYHLATASLEKNAPIEDIKAALDSPVDWSGLLEALEDDEGCASLLDLLIEAWESGNSEDDGKELEALMRKLDEQNVAFHEERVQRIEAQRKQELLFRADAESNRLRALFGLHNGSIQEPGDVLDSAVSV